MMRSPEKARLRTLTLLPLAAAVLGACAITPEPMKMSEVRSRVQADQLKIYGAQEPVFAPISFGEALARSLKYNLDYRLKLMEHALSKGLNEVTNYEMLPNLVASAGYHARDNLNGSQSFTINPDGSVTETSPPTYSGGQERRRTTASVELTWSVLDFGVGYYRARQQSNQVLIAEERRRRVVQNILSDVRSAYWRAAGAQRLTRDVDALMVRVRSALARSREAEAQGLMPPRDALSYQRQLLDAVSLLTTRRQELDFAKRELAALMNITPGTDFTVVEEAEPELMPVPINLAEMEELALLNRPELRQEDLQVRITADETRKQMMHLFPNLSLSVGPQYDSNKYLYNNNWLDSSLRLSFNLLKALSIPATLRAQDAQVLTDDTRRMALSMAILTQTRVAIERYRLALNDMEVAQESNQVDQRLASYARAAFSTKADSELELIRAETRSLNSAFQRAATYAAAQTAFGRIYNSIGLDVVPEGIEDAPLNEIGSKVLNNLAQIENDTFVRITAPTPVLPALTLTITSAMGVEPGAINAAKEGISNALKRNQIAVNTENSSLNLRMTLEFGAPQNSVRQAHWGIRLTDASGKQLGSSRYTSTMPLQPSVGAVRAFAESAAISNLRNFREWMELANNPANNPANNQAPVNP